MGYKAISTKNNSIIAKIIVKKVLSLQGKKKHTFWKRKDFSMSSKQKKVEDFILERE